MRPPGGVNLKQVDQHPHELGPVHVGVELGLAAQQHGDAPVVRGGSEAVEDLAHQGHQVGVHVGHRHPVGIDAGQVEEVIHLLQQRAGVALDSREAEALPLAELAGLLDELVHRAEDQGQRGAQLVAHVGEEAGLVAVELLEALQGHLQLAVLARQLGAAGDLLGDVAALGQQEGHPALVVEDGRQREVDDDGAAAVQVTEDLEVAAHEAAGAGFLDHLPHALPNLFRHRPPAGLPEGLADHVLEAEAGTVEGRLVDLQHSAVQIQQAQKLVHRVEDDAGHLLAPHLAGVAGLDHHAAHRGAPGHPADIVIRIHVDPLHALRLPAGHPPTCAGPARGRRAPGLWGTRMRVQKRQV